MLLTCLWNWAGHKYASIYLHLGLKIRFLHCTHDSSALTLFHTLFLFSVIMIVYISYDILLYTKTNLEIELLKYKSRYLKDYLTRSHVNIMQPNI